MTPAPAAKRPDPDPVTVAARFGPRLRYCRLAAGLTQARLGEMVGQSQGVVASLEAGARVPRWDTAVKIATALGVCVSEFTRE